MHKTALIALALAGGVLWSQPSQAASRSAGVPSLPSDTILVEGGCGPGGFRAANGYCYRRPAYAPPPPYYRRPCPPGYHLSPRGFCRPNY